jgi:hypothetical protein
VDASRWSCPARASVTPNSVWQSTQSGGGPFLVMWLLLPGQVGAPAQSGGRLFPVACTHRAVSSLPLLSELTGSARSPRWVCAVISPGLPGQVAASTRLAGSTDPFSVRLLPGHLAVSTLRRRRINPEISSNRPSEIATSILSARWSFPVRLPVRCGQVGAPIQSGAHAFLSSRHTDPVRWAVPSSQVGGTSWSRAAATRTG